MPHLIVYLRHTALALAGTLLAGNATAADAPVTTYSPYASDAAEKRVLWGDTHLHTSLSLDARAFGVTLEPDSAYRLARGEQVVSTQGQNVRLSWPLDFLVVSDHSDAMGTMTEIIDGNPEFLENKVIASWYERLSSSDAGIVFKARMDVMQALTEGTAPEMLEARDFFKSVWERYLQAAEAFNEPGRFTAMIGYEWTSSPQGSNLHRNILYRDGADLAVQALPFTSTESSNPEDLWRWLQAYEDKTGG